MRNKETIVACICEGNAEEAVVNILLDHDKLIFDRSQMLEEKVIRERSATTFERKYLNREFGDKKIIIYRILDSRKEKFNLSKVYHGKIEVIDIITAPEIEMLIIHNENKFADFKKYANKGLKPSEYCKQILKLPNVKNKKYILSYFNDIANLTRAIKEHKSKANIKSGEKTLADILK